MTDKLLEYLVPVLIAGYLLKIWTDDFRSRNDANPPAKPLPGATPCGVKWVLVGVLGAWIILGFETGGEWALGITSEQKVITLFALFPILAAAITEEVVFRGFLVAENRGRLALVGSIVGFSAVFALIHDFLWSLDMPEDVPIWQFWEGAFELRLDAKGFFSTAIVFVNSLWFYALRFLPPNGQRSLVPCFVAHAASNLGVFVIKWAQGYVSGIW